MRRPLVGLTTDVERVAHGVWEEDAAFTPCNYLDALGRAGAAPLLLPPGPDPVPALAPLRGLVLIGGPDVDPDLYGAAPHPRTDRPRRHRDDWEMALCRAALAADLPVLAVCRGIQLLNVTLGGTLHQHLEEVVGHRGHLTVEGQMSRNPVVVATRSRLAQVVGVATTGLCHHHQALDRIGAGLAVTARAPDGTVEAVELPDRRFVLGVQWHPEEDPSDKRIFEAFVESCR